MVINTDAHCINHLLYIEYGVAQARRGWAGHTDIINTYPAEELLAFMKK